ncbi:hypothetical protein BMR07_14240 [Methylococcaceae bacterium CS1]|nr:hypothetical protein BMR10_16090 [Methylococcaceae bacterium CS4]TXK98715.1 hypothetical protein BMR11_08025 [Methylococcaceae bacterium CS5]TXL03795.1 hypothetical protein BMR07_14240 [Methylococcaceae bacterium CS1]TXL07349.1 hypothetical protein BMR09_05570 [Methylococcaceae bacterium CS3]
MCKVYRTQIYFEELLFADVKRQANNLGLSLSAYIRKTLEKDLEERKKNPQTLDFSDFSGMWENREISQESIRKQAWK